jgi:3-hydroxybutyryl-CoA dehydratase
MNGKTIDQMHIGDRAETTKTISESDVYGFAGITGDFNPAHVNEVYAAGTFFETRIAHGLLPAGLISSVLAMQLPGPGTIYMSQELRFTAPVRIGDTITAVVEVAEIDAEKGRVTLTTRCFNQEDAMVIDGWALVSPPKKPPG